MDIKEFIKKARPSLSESSIITYASVLRSLYSKVFHSKDVDVSRFKQVNTVLDFLKDVPANKRKSILSALVIVTNDPKYREQMLADVKQYDADISTQVKTEEQKENWVTTDEVKQVFETLEKHAKLLYKKGSRTTADMQEIQNYVIVALLGGIFIPPRRSLDYCDFKITDIDPTLNYFDKKNMIFNNYKTAKYYGQQTVMCPPALYKILKKWISVNPTPYLLMDTNGAKLTPVKLNQRLNKIFDGKKISVNALRHCYLTDKYGDTIKTNDALAADMTAMSSSINQATLYIKRD
jgi:integrase